MSVAVPVIWSSFWTVAARVERVAVILASTMDEGAEAFAAIPLRARPRKGAWDRAVFVTAGPVLGTKQK